MMLLSPVPLVLLGLRHPLRRSLLVLLAASLIVALFVGPLSALSYFFAFGILGITIGRLSAQGKSSVELLLWGIPVSLAGKLLLMVLLTKLMGLNPFDLDLESMKEMFEKFLPMISDGQTAAVLKTQLENVMKMVPLLFPATVTLAAAADCLLSCWFSEKITARLGGMKIPALPHLSSWRFPRSILGAFVAAIICIYWGTHEDINGSFGLLTRVGLNLRLLVSIFFIAQGLAVGAFFLEKRSKSRTFVVAMVFAALLIPLLSQLALVTGVLDQWWDFRVRFGGEQS